ncbi:(deoxy)nucleoside triphosphate pyrophosphohydrolase [Mammaliicoccus stepanovicii]|nr:(deoxy)nucleoside triphosphate pyrophosphohydrolase [Mammaliicoccus stepanovicii]
MIKISFFILLKIEKRVINIKTIHVSAGVMVNQNQEYFCCQRPINKTMGGYWEFPGGKIKQDEDPVNALKREIKEELDTNINVIKFLGQSQYDYEFGRVILEVFLCELAENKYSLIEHQDSKWLRKEELSKLDFAPADIEILEWL